MFLQLFVTFQLYRLWLVSSKSLSNIHSLLTILYTMKQRTECLHILWKFKDQLFLELHSSFHSMLYLLPDLDNFCLVKHCLPFSACNSLQRNTTGDQEKDWCNTGKLWCRWKVKNPELGWNDNYDNLEYVIMNLEERINRKWKR